LHVETILSSIPLDGWCVLRFTWGMIEEQPEKVIAMVREAIEMLAKQS
jgi:very-short-patch-repair endonuclease